LLFEPNDQKLKAIEEDCKLGRLMCGEHKQMLSEKVTEFLVEHQRRREKAKDVVESFFLNSEEALNCLLFKRDV
jgi:tryptophanyl-tRNA synthetase